MAAFRFTLQPLLQHRQAIEDQRQRDLAKLLRQKMIYQNQIRQMQTGITDAKHQLAGSLVGKVDLEGVGGFARYSGQLAQRAQAIVLDMVRLEKAIQMARELLLKATRDRQALELLRQRQYEQWLAAQLRRETAELDEITMQRHARLILTEQRS
ncbi:MAG: flagellar export protein FliJ [Phycisphaeraceae bacterium]|nr:flagellar export protein FliJ [Phycisphaeraceae bacterium]